MVDFYDSTPEDREAQKRAATRRRTVFLSILTVVAVGIRLAVKNPPPPKSPDHAGEPFRALPGMLQNLPESERAKLSPDMLAKMQEADQKGRSFSKPDVAVAKGPAYTPQAAPADLRTDEQKAADVKFQYAARKATVRDSEPMRQEDITKDMLVVFSRGGYIKAESAERTQGLVDIRLDRTARARVPQKIVRSISSQAHRWQEPVPAGFVKLKPARGVTITLHRASANRITISKGPNESKTPKI